MGTGIAEAEAVGHIAEQEAARTVVAVDRTAGAADHTAVGGEVRTAVGEEVHTAGTGMGEVHYHTGFEERIAAEDVGEERTVERAEEGHTAEEEEGRTARTVGLLVAEGHTAPEERQAAVAQAEAGAPRQFVPVGQEVQGMRWADRPRGASWQRPSGGLIDPSPTAVSAVPSPLVGRETRTNIQMTGLVQNDVHPCQARISERL